MVGRKGDAATDPPSGTGHVDHYKAFNIMLAYAHETHESCVR
jgi:hypothetical protein